MTREQSESKMRETTVGSQVCYIGPKIAWLESGMVGVIYAVSSRDGKRDIEFQDGKAATIRPYDLSNWEAL